MKLNRKFLPEIILVNTQLPENLGATARSMLNFEIDELRVVNPKFSLDHEKIIPVSAGAEKVINKSRCFENIESAIDDINFLIACTARKRSSNKKCLNLNNSVKELNIKIKEGNSVGIIFGPENAGLTNKDLSVADRIMLIETNPFFSSLNLSHAVLIVCYELFKENNDIHPLPTFQLSKNRGAKIAPPMSPETQNSPCPVGLIVGLLLDESQYKFEYVDEKRRQNEIFFVAKS